MIRARCECPPGGAAKRGMSAISCLLPSIMMRAPDCLDSPVYEPDEEHATALCRTLGNAWTPSGECKQRAR